MRHAFNPAMKPSAASPLSIRWLHPVRMLVVLALSAFGSTSAALTFVAVQQWSLPPSDGAYGQSIGATLHDPFVLMVLVPTVGWSIAASWLLAHSLLLGRNLLHSFVIVIAAVEIELIVLTPLAGPLAILLSFAVLLTAMGFCRSTRWSWIARGGLAWLGDPT